MSDLAEEPVNTGRICDELEQKTDPETGEILVFCSFCQQWRSIDAFQRNSGKGRKPRRCAFCRFSRWLTVRRKAREVEAKQKTKRARSMKALCKPFAHQVDWCAARVTQYEVKPMSFEISEHDKPLEPISDDAKASVLEAYQVGIARLTAQVLPHLGPMAVANCLFSGTAEILRKYFPAEVVAEALTVAAEQVLEQNKGEVTH